MADQGLKSIRWFNPPRTMLTEFRNFILKGNVIDLSTGVIIGASFGKIVTAFTDGVVAPILSLAGGDPKVGLKVGVFDLGLIISAIIGFLITAAVIFFVIIKPANALMSRMKRAEAAAPPPGPTAEETLLTEIRDLLKAKA
ncbi:MAG: large conductance mechanosensitive channel protein MscL [Luteolibacter sp.]|uniref:large conductance mechanosensitive channel protein MscL n=1 Tax=Luteolibacter sp. TaxID=1962973 RepID=UPI003267130E